MGQFSDLLALQELDTKLAQLHHRRSHLPEQVQLRECDEKLKALAARLAPTEATVADFDKKQAALEAAIAELEKKMDSASKQLYGGTVSASRELQALEADIASLKKHRGELEDNELSLLVEREPHDAFIVDGTKERNAIDAEAKRLHVASAEATIDIDANATRTSAEREAWAPKIEATLLACYEKIRAGNSGIGAAALEHGTCMACRIKLPSGDMDRIRQAPEHQVNTCEGCGVILVLP
jgi:uncharacterized protein